MIINNREYIHCGQHTLSGDAPSARKVLTAIGNLINPPKYEVHYTITRHKASFNPISYMAVEATIRRSTVDKSGYSHAQVGDAKNTQKLLKLLSEKNIIEFSARLPFTSLTNFRNHSKDYNSVEAPLFDNNNILISDPRTFQIDEDNQSMSIRVGNPNQPDYSVHIRLVDPKTTHKKQI